MPAPPGQPEPRDIRLGAFPQFDPRSRDFQVRELLTALSIRVPRSYTWARAAQMNQGNVGACVGFSLLAEVGSKPKARLVSDPLAFDVYHLAQNVFDEWPGNNYEGTSLLAGMKAAIAKGYYPTPTPDDPTYRWAGAGSGRANEDLALAIGYLGPAVVAIPWFDHMFTPDSSGRIHPSGALAGRHAIEARGFTARWPGTVSMQARSFDNLDQDASYYRLPNSWGAWWGVAGECFLSLRDMGALLAQQGEGLIPVRRN